VNGYRFVSRKDTARAFAENAFVSTPLSKLLRPSAENEEEPHAKWPRDTRQLSTESAYYWERHQRRLRYMSDLAFHLGRDGQLIVTPRHDGRRL
jgi:hypothetical protein